MFMLTLMLYNNTKGKYYVKKNRNIWFVFFWNRNTNC